MAPTASALAMHAPPASEQRCPAEHAALLHPPFSFKPRLRTPAPPALQAVQRGPAFLPQLRLQLLDAAGREVCAPGEAQPAAGPRNAPLLVRVAVRRLVLGRQWTLGKLHLPACWQDGGGG